VYQIADALRRLGCELDVSIFEGKPVKKIVTESGHVRGVELQGDEFIPARQVISNVDVTTTFQNLIPGIESITSHESSVSGFILLLGVSKQHPGLAHHNIFFSMDYRKEFDHIFRQGIPSEDPTIYVSISSKSDPQHAPDGCENWFVLVNAPPVSDKVNWHTYKDEYRDIVLDKLAKSGFDIRDAIQVERIITPVNLAEDTGAWRGALYGASPNNRMAAFRRPHNRSNKVRGLYFAGGTTHPGGGVPMVTLSGKLAAEKVLEDR
jgi:phytoene desaturase